MIINYYLTEIVYDYRNNVLIINEVIRKDKIILLKELLHHEK